MKSIKNGIRGFFVVSGIACLLIIAACGGNVNQKQTDTPTSGRITVGVDDSYRLLIEAEAFTFGYLYKYAHPDIVYKTEADVINDFMNDSVPMIIVNRKLSDKQVQALKDQQYIPRTTKIAIDALALIVNNNNPDTALFYKAVKDIFQGKIRSWKQINPKSKLKDVTVVFDNFKSGNPRYFKEKFALDSFPANCFAAKNNAEVINYVEKNKNAIGVISVNWISDPADTVSHNFLKRFKVVGIAMEGENSPDAKFYRPFPGYIYEGSYPFTREVYCINRQSYTGLAHGFSSFIAGEKGQFIVLHSGLVPAAMPVRIVEIKH
ncbi:MAG: substrate-binding domain-containing protein [Bacteroidota bacterium]